MASASQLTIPVYNNFVQSPNGSDTSAVPLRKIVHAWAPWGHGIPTIKPGRLTVWSNATASDRPRAGGECRAPTAVSACPPATVMLQSGSEVIASLPHDNGGLNYDD